MCWAMAHPCADCSFPLERNAQKPSTPPGKSSYRLPNPKPTPPPQQPNVPRSNAAARPRAATAAKALMTHPHPPGLNRIAPCGASSAQISATGCVPSPIAPAVMLCIVPSPTAVPANSTLIIRERCARSETDWVSGNRTLAVRLHCSGTRLASRGLRARHYKLEILTNCFPMFSPRSIPRKAETAFSMPSATVSRYFSLPSWCHLASRGSASA